MIEDILDIFVPESHVNCTLDNFDWTGREKLRDFIDRFCNPEVDKGLILIGVPGVGKTHLAVGIFRYFLEQGLPIGGGGVLFLEWRKLLQELLGGLGTTSPEGIIERILDSEIVIIDDIRPTKGQLWVDVIKTLIEGVYEKRKKVLITANLEDDSDLIRTWKLEDYWVSRLAACFDIVRVKGKDYRIA